MVWGRIAEYRMAGPLTQIGADGGRRISTAGGQVLAGVGESCCCAGGGNPCVGAPSAIAILNYTDTYFSPCSDCTAGLPADCVWDGTFQFFDSSSCTFSNGQCFSGANGCNACKFHSSRMWQYAPPGVSSVWFDTASGNFYMQIVCQNAPAGGEIVWQGLKVGGSTFSGTYSRTGGCDPRSTVEIA